MDELDEKIIAILKENSRRSNVDIAKELGTSEGTIRLRIRRMLSDGIIQKFTIKTRSKNLTAFVDVKVNTNVKTTEVSQRIRELPGVEAVYEISGDFDIIVLVDVGNTEELNSIIDQIRPMGVESTRTKMILKDY